MKEYEVKFLNFLIGHLYHDINKSLWCFKYSEEFKEQQYKDFFNIPEYLSDFHKVYKSETLWDVFDKAFNAKTNITIKEKETV